MDISVSKEVRKWGLKKIKKTLGDHYESHVYKYLQTELCDYSKEYFNMNGYGTSIIIPDDVYKDKLESIIFDLTNKNNIVGKNLLDTLNVLNRQEIHDIINMKPHEMNPKQWEKQLKYYENTDMANKNRKSIAWKNCRRCKNNEWSIRREQTRSLDEPETVYYTCKHCDLVIKFNN